MRPTTVYNIHTCRRKRSKSADVSSSSPRENEYLEKSKRKRYNSTTNIEVLARQFACPLADCDGAPDVQCRDIAEYMENDRTIRLLATHEARRAVASNDVLESPLYDDHESEARALQEELASIARKRKLVRARADAYTEKLRDESAAVSSVPCSACGAEPGETCWNLNSLKRGHKLSLVSVHVPRLTHYRKTERSRLYVRLVTAMQRILEEA